jgi:hypothetical protein
MHDRDLLMPPQQRKRRRAFWPWLLIVLGAITTVTAIVMVTLIIVNAEKARSWPTTTGRIEASSVHTVEFHYRSGGLYYRYEPHVDYSYAVAGHAYRSPQISWGGRAMYQDYDDAARDLERDYPVGRSVRVFYDPAHPATAIIEQDNVYYGPFIGLPFGPLLIFWGLRLRRRARQADA